MFKHVNGYLRTGISYGSKAMTIDMIKGMTEELETTTEERVVYRGGIPEGFKVGDTLIDKGFISTSKDEDVAFHYALTNGVMMRVKLPKGVKAIDMAKKLGHDYFYKHEKEIILAPGTPIKVTGMVEDNYYDAEVVV